MNITRKQVLKTTLLPGILPRLGALFGSGFSTLSYLIALVYNTVRILPDNHPYLKPEMVGQYNSRQVIAEAANHIQPNRKNIDQLIIFFSVIAALFILLIQFILLIIAMAIPAVRAQEATATGTAMPTTIREFFVTPSPENDIAYRLLDLVFGIPNFFGSKEQTLTPIHQALHSLFEFYSIGILIVGAMIIIYFTVAIVSETAQSGTPFGQRFNKAWAPVRVILFFGLLIPISNGLNGGQYITLASAKLGSSLASTGWVLFNTKIEEANETLTGRKSQNIARIKPADLSHVPSFMLIAKTCQAAYASKYNDREWKPAWDPGPADESGEARSERETGVQAWAVIRNAAAQERLAERQRAMQDLEKEITLAKARLEGLRSAGGEGPEAGSGEEASPAEIRAAEQRVGNLEGQKEEAEEGLEEAEEDASNRFIAKKMEGETFQNLSEESKGSDIHIVFGVRDSINYKLDRANVRPVCGSVVLKVTDVEEPGSAVIHTAYYNLVKDMWQGTDSLFAEMKTYAENFSKRGLSNISDPTAELPTDEFKEKLIKFLRDYMGGDGSEEASGVIGEAITAQIENGEWQMPNEMKNYGWGGAGIWYNKIAQQNGALVSAIQQTPVNVLYPLVMERIKDSRQQENKTPGSEDRFDTDNAADAPPVSSATPGDDEIANVLNHVYKFWEGEEERTEQRLTGNAFIDTINVVLGTQGLFEICENTDIHPLAQISAVGKSMLDRAIGTFAASGLFSVLSIIPSPFHAAASSFASFFGTIASVGLLIGFILFYVVPFLPFIYFFFAVGGWVKGIFEAMVAMPLWALAHLRIDGEGIPGDAAIGGYFLIFEIFIRPILIVFGLLAAVVIFGTMVKVLNEVFYLAISNLSGHDPKSNTACFQTPEGEVNPDLKDSYRGPVDEFFFTVLYTIIVYMIGMSAFKLIDTIPNQILRWINAEVPSFNDNAGDAAEGLLKYVTIGGSQFGSQIGQGISGVGDGIKTSVHSFLNK